MAAGEAPAAARRHEGPIEIDLLLDLVGIGVDDRHRVAVVQRDEQPFLFAVQQYAIGRTADTDPVRDTQLVAREVEDYDLAAAHAGHVSLRIAPDCHPERKVAAGDAGLGGVVFARPEIAFSDLAALLEVDEAHRVVFDIRDDESAAVPG